MNTLDRDRVETTPSDDDPSSDGRRLGRSVGSPGQIELLKAARDNRGVLSDFPVRLSASVSSLVAAGLLAVDVVGYSLTLEGVLRLAEIEEVEASHRPQAPR